MKTKKDSSNEKAAWKQKTYSLLRRHIGPLVLQLTGWFLFFIAWLACSAWRYSSDPQHEFYSFFLIPIAIYLFYFISYKGFYRKQKVGMFFISGLLICAAIATIEYFYVIDTILQGFHPNSPEQAIETKRYATTETALSITLRDLAIFSIIGFALVFKDALKYNQQQKKALQYLHENERIQKEVQSHLAHEHFIGNILKSFLIQHPERREELEPLIELSSFSFNHTDNSIYPVSEEIKFARNLLDSYQKQYPDLSIHFCQKGERTSLYILPLVSEPLIGNMFKHGITGKDGEMKVEFNFSNPDLIKICCENKVEQPLTFSREDAKGLKILHKRLAMTYQEDASLELETQEDRVRITLTIRP